MKILINNQHDQAVQEFVERCMAIVWSEYIEYNEPTDALEEVMDDMGIDQSELVELFAKCGYTDFY